MSNIPDTTEARPNLTFREKTLWLILVTTAVVYAVYFWRAVSIGAANPGRVGGLFVEAVILVIVLQIAGSIVIAIRARPQRADERDRQTAVAATRNAYLVLFVGTWFALGVAALTLGAFWIVHVLLLAVVLAELTRWASELYYYRSGV
jgi:hypothetical protein